MADTSNTPAPSKSGFLARLGLSRKKWATGHIAPAKEIGQEDTYLYGAGTTTVASLLGHGARGGRARQIIYEKWMRMEGDPIVSSALQLLVTSALGGHETSGDLVFVEKTAEAKKDKRLAAIADEISASLTHLFNKVAFHIAYTGAAYGDAYARIYANSSGVVDLDSNEMIRPQLVQPYEMGSRTVGFAVSVGERNFTRLDVSQLARLKMPRIQWIPQFGVVEKSLTFKLTENDIENLPIMPSMVGGSLLYNAEEPYDNLTASLLGLVGQRWMDSIDEQIFTLNLDSMTKEQQEHFVESVKQMLLKSKDRAEEAVKNGRPIMERIRHIVPIFGEKQMATMGPANGGAPGRAASISIEDVLLHAKLLSGALGVDLSMLGFADQLSGGLGEGGFFRVSAQAAERARIIRVALEDFFNHVIDIHTANRYGFVFNPSNRPWEINFFGSISALEAEKQRTRLESMNAGMMLVQSMQQLKDMGASKDLMSEFLAKTMMLDEDQAKMYASIVDTQPQDGGGDGGGFGGGRRGQMDSVWNDDAPLLADAALDGVGSMTTIPIPAKTVKWLGFDGTMTLRADLHALAERHKEYYDGDPDAVLADIQFVLKQPDDWFIHSKGKVAIFREARGTGRAAMVRIEMEISGKTLVVRSVFQGGKRQIATKMNASKRELERLGLGSPLPGSLSVAEYLAALGNRSLRAVPPSGGSPKA